MLFNAEEKYVDKIKLQMIFDNEIPADFRSDYLVEHLLLPVDGADDQYQLQSKNLLRLMGKLGIVQPDPPIIASGHARKISSDEDYAAVLMLIKRCANAASKVPAKETFSGTYCPTPPADSA